jgi:hypothetical protein
MLYKKESAAEEKEEEQDGDEKWGQVCESFIS